MHLFKSDWLREPPRPVVGSYARRVYGTRFARRPEVDAYAAALTLAGLPSPAYVPAASPPQPPRLDRAA